jgi:choline-sulfatase
MQSRVLLTLAVMLTILPAPAWAQAPRQPNVVWIVADDLAAHMCGAYGNRQVKTPNIDRLAAAGMRFDRAYCNSPVCTASRQSVLTGRYPRTIGVTLLATPLPESEMTLAELLAALGYTTAAIGKMHFNSNLPHGFQLRLDRGDHAKALANKPRQPIPKDIDVLSVWRPFKDPARVWLNSFHRPYPAADEDMTGTWFARKAADYLQQKRQQPFFLVVSFYEPHSPFHFPIEYRNRHKPESFSVPKVGPEDDWQIPAIFRGLTDPEKQGIIASYATSVEFLDRNVGIVLEALRQAGLEEDTLVIFFGDHGYMLGEHGRFEKHCMYEPAIRAPLLIRFPGRIPPRQSTAALVEFIDIVPTVLDYCGAAVPGNVQGKTLRPVLDGRSRTHRDHVFVEYAENEEAAVRGPRWKLTYCTGKRERKDGYATGKPSPGRVVQLFDMENDPDEQKNLAGLPEHARRVEEMTTLLADHMKRTGRQPELLPKQGDVHQFLEFCLQPGLRLPAGRIE